MNAIPVTLTKTRRLACESCLSSNILSTQPNTAGGTAGKMYPGSLDCETEKKSRGHKNQHVERMNRDVAVAPSLGAVESRFASRNIPMDQGKRAMSRMGM